MKKVLGSALLLALSAVCSPGSSPAPSTESTSTTESLPTASIDAPAGEAKSRISAILGSIPVSEEKLSGYDRDLFGEPWLDIDKNGCDTRNDILFRDLQNTVVSEDCKVQTGVAVEPYTGKTITFWRDNADGAPTKDTEEIYTSRELPIDHLVALSNAFVTGGGNLSAEEKLQISNDPINLSISDEEQNSGEKSDRAADQWVPPNPAAQCGYVIRQTLVKEKYRLWMSSGEKKAIERVLEECSEETAAANLANPEGPLILAGNSSVPVIPEVMPSVTDAGPPAGRDPLFSSCTKAKAGGFGPYTAADPEFSNYQDGDGDGVVCE